jgi:hypothetical protein
VSNDPISHLRILSTHTWAMQITLNDSPCPRCCSKLTIVDVVDDWMTSGLGGPGAGKKRSIDPSLLRCIPYGWASVVQSVI